MSELAPISTNIFDTQCQAILEPIICGHHPADPKNTNSRNHPHYDIARRHVRYAVEEGHLTPGALLAFSIEGAAESKFYIALGIEPNAMSETASASTMHGLERVIAFCHEHAISAVALPIDTLHNHLTRSDLANAVHTAFRATPIAVQLVRRTRDERQMIPTEFLPQKLRTMISADPSPFAAANDIIDELQLASRYRRGDCDIVITNGALYRLGPEDVCIHPRGNAGSGWTTHTPQPDGSTLSIHTTNLWGPYAIDPADRNRYPNRGQSIEPDPYRATISTRFGPTEALLQPAPIGSSDTPKILAWTSAQARIFLHRETDQIAYNHMLEHPSITSRSQPDPNTPHTFTGPLLWINEKHLIQQVQETLVIHALADLHPNLRIVPQLTQPITVTYDGSGSGMLTADSNSPLTPSSTYVHFGAQDATAYTVGRGPLSSLRFEGFAHPKMELAFRLITKHPAVTESVEFLTDVLLSVGQITITGDDQELTHAVGDILEERFSIIAQQTRDKPQYLSDQKPLNLHIIAYETTAQ